ncbi:ATP-binding protein [Streptomyces chiangmaiensis]
MLFARTTALAGDHVLTHPLPAHPEAASIARNAARSRLQAWDMDEDTTFTTELIVSELVGNAIRYGAPPLQLRLIHDRMLTCEVTDSATSAPTSDMPAPSTKAAEACSSSPASPTSGAPAITRGERPFGPSNRQGAAHARHDPGTCMTPQARVHTARAWSGCRNGVTHRHRIPRDKYLKGICRGPVVRSAFEGTTDLTDRPRTARPHISPAEGGRACSITIL